jgi:RNA polymerase sigma-70 factor (ECF subfamily)
MTQADDAFVSIFHEVQANLCRFLEVLLGNHSLAQDIAQESFLRLHRYGVERLPPGEARFWLFRVARNLALNELAKGRTRMNVISKVVDLFYAAPQTPEQVAAHREQQEKVFALIHDLPEHQRAALLLREQEEMSYTEIARILRISESKVKSDIFRARCALREKWHDLDQSSARAV